VFLGVQDCVFVQSSDGVHGQVRGTVSRNAVLDQPAHGCIGAFAADEGHGHRFILDIGIDDGFLDALGGFPSGW